MSDENIVTVIVGLACPKCGANDWRVWTSRKRIGKIIRVRECKSCLTRVKTQETIKKNSPYMDCF